MRFLLPLCSVIILVLALYVTTGVDIASAHSPDIRPVETSITIIEEDEGYYNEPIVKSTDGSVRAFPTAKGGVASPAYATLPGVDAATMDLLQELRHGPEAYLESLQAEEMDSVAFIIGAALIPGSVWDLPWVDDGQTDDEKIALDFLRELSGFNPEAAERVAVMPFLQTFGPGDTEALWSLTYLAEYDDEEETTVLIEVLDNPHLADGGGIDDEEAKVVTVLGGTNYFNPEMVGVLLDPSQTTVTERRLQGYTGEILMAIIRTDPGDTSTFDILEFAVERAEITMAKQLRTDYVALLVADDVLPSFVAGAHFGTHIAIPTRFDVEDRGEHPGDWAGILLAHEVAHYYWFSDHPLWVIEGAADFMAGVSEYHRVGRRMDPDNVPCSYYQSLLHLELAKPELSSYGGLCHYTLGERMLLDMHETIDDAGFFLSFRDFHERITDDDSAAIPAVNHLTRAFLPNGLSGTEETIRKLLLAKHYGSILNTDTSPVNPAIPALNGGVVRAELIRVEQTDDGIALVERLSGFPRISASRVVGRYLFTLVIGTAEPLPEDTEVEFELVEYFQDGWVFDRTATTRTYLAGYAGGLTPVGGIGFIPDFRWPTGLYWFYVYHQDQKIAEMHLEVTP